MGADSVLVNAAMKLGMSRVPGDTAEIFNKQYEGLIAYHKASAEATVEGVKLGGIMAQKGVTAIQKGIKDRKTRKTDADYQARDKANLFSKEGWKEGAVEVRKGNRAERKRIKEEDTETREWATGKKEKLQEVTDKLYSDSKKKEKEDKQADRDADLQLYEDKLEAKRESKNRQNQKPYKTDDGKWKTVEQIERETFRSQEDEESTFGGDFGYQLGGRKSGGLSNPSLLKKLSPFKQQEEETKTVSRNDSKQSATSVSPPVENETPSTTDMNNTIEQMVTDLAVDGITNTSDHYNKGGGMNNGHFEAADLAMTTIKNKIYNIINQKSISTEDIKSKSKLQKDAVQLKENLIDMKALVIKTANAYNESHVNPDLSFMGFPNEQMLIKQVMDPKADLQKLGIRAYWRDGELHYDYGDSQMFREYASNNNVEVDEEAPEAQPTKTIAATKLFNMAVLKDLKSENDINGVISKAGENAIETLGNTKKLINPDFSRVEASLKNDFRNILEAKDANLQDIFTRDVMIGTTKRNYKKDLEANPEINALTYADLGLTDSIDKNGDGVLSSDELTDNDKAVIIETLTNPRTSEQKEAAILEAEKYYNQFAFQEFNHMKNVNKSESLLAKDLIAKYSNA